MVGDREWGIVVQARMGSTRLPGKMLRPVHKGRNLLETVLQRLLSTYASERIVLATTIGSEDDPLVGIAGAAGVAVHRGSSANVLDRFIGAAAQMGWRHVIRVCADNPLLQVRSMAPLVQAGLEGHADYVAYYYSDGLPSIRSHCGLFPEWVAVEALERAAAEDPAVEYLEHVTNYLYTNDRSFSIRRIPIPHEEQIRKWRLTVDTQADLDLCRRTLDELGDDGSMDLEHLCNYLELHPDMLEEMRLNKLPHEK